jgi:hypothetical protein
VAELLPLFNMRHREGFGVHVWSNVSGDTTAS